MDKSKITKTYNEGIDAVITVVKDMSSHIDLLGGTITGLHTEISSLNTEMGSLNWEIRELKNSGAKQDMRIAELEARLNQNRQQEQQ